MEKRRNFEYMMKRQPLQTIDAMRYIQYELNLDALRLQRKERHGNHTLSLMENPFPLQQNPLTHS